MSIQDNQQINILYVGSRKEETMRLFAGAEATRGEYGQNDSQKPHIICQSNGTIT
jgi:hypothetical protein